jgi:PKD repeat protein
MILSLGLGLGLAAGPGCGSPCFDDPMEVTVTADVQQGPAPLTVTLTANATERVCGCCDGDDTDIISYGWDLDDDGTLDQVGESLHQVEHTYDATGTYTARVIVTDAGERTAEDTVTITVQ